MRAAEFTPKNVKNINDFDTFGEAAKWMEKNGWRNRFYDNVTRDIVDETLLARYYSEAVWYDEDGNKVEKLDRYAPRDITLVAKWSQN